MRIDIATLFPEMCEAVLDTSIIGRARRAGFIEVYCHNIRDFSLDKHRKTDDTPYGGGVGMVMTCQPIYDCYKSIREKMVSLGAEIHFSSRLVGITSKNGKIYWSIKGMVVDIPNTNRQMKYIVPSNQSAFIPQATQRFIFVFNCNSLISGCNPKNKIKGNKSKKCAIPNMSDSKQVAI